MNQLSMRRMTGAFGLASVGIWLALFPLYTMQPPASLYDGAATDQALLSIRNIVFTRVLLGGNADPSVVRALTIGYLLIYNGSIAFVMTGLHTWRQSDGSWWPASS